MKSRYLSVILSLILCNNFLYGQNSQDTIHYTIEKPHVRPWVAFGEVILINYVVNRVNTLRPDGDFAHVNWDSWKRNIERGFEWDWNNFGTNWISHPYHGGTYFNAARSLGMNFWESSPYAATGSLIWEFLGETHPASANDFICTTLGGMFLGESFHRITENILDDRTTGINRVWREGVTLFLDPLKFFNRALTGRLTRRTTYLTHNRSHTDAWLYAVGSGIFSSLKEGESSFLH